MTNLRAQTLTRPTNGLATREPEDWRLDAECRDWDHTLEGDPWHPDSDLPSAYDDARTICAGCPVAEACLQVALEAESRSHGALRFGMYGGTTPAERTAVFRKQLLEQAARRAAA
ncbi:WhiB family transcriptional regulator [Oerskovia enterophila]